MIDDHEIDDLIDMIAEQRTENAEVNELERMYYDIQLASLEDYNKEELYTMYVELGLDE